MNRKVRLAAAAGLLAAAPLLAATGTAHQARTRMYVDKARLDAAVAELRSMR